MANEDWYAIYVEKLPSWQRLIYALHNVYDLCEPVAYFAEESVAKALLIPENGLLYICLRGFHLARLDNDADKRDVGIIIDGIWKRTGKRVKFFSIYWDPITHLHRRPPLPEERILYIYSP